MAEKDAATVLEEAADLLLIHGRCTYNAKDQAGRYCVVGAVMAARGLDVKVGPVTDTTTPLIQAGDFAVGYADPAVLAVGHHLRVPNVAVWNDETLDDFKVIDALRLVAKSLRRNEAGY
jgi:hypothetical protein